jgi:hypothetical protein
MAKKGSSKWSARDKSKVSAQRKTNQVLQVDLSAPEQKAQTAGQIETIEHFIKTATDFLERGVDELGRPPELVARLPVVNVALENLKRKHYGEQLLEDEVAQRRPATPLYSDSFLNHHLATAFWNAVEAGGVDEATLQLMKFAKWLANTRPGRRAEAGNIETGQLAYEMLVNGNGIPRRQEMNRQCRHDKSVRGGLLRPIRKCSPQGDSRRYTFVASISAFIPHPIRTQQKKPSGEAELTTSKENGCDRDRTDDLYRVKVALIPTELRTRRIDKL